MIPQIHWLCFDGDNVDEIEAVVELLADSRSHLANEVRLAPKQKQLLLDK